MQNNENVFTYKIGKYTIKVIEENKPSERAIEMTNAKINEALIQNELR